MIALLFVRLHIFTDVLQFCFFCMLNASSSPVVLKSKFIYSFAYFLMKSSSLVLDYGL